MTTPTSSGLAPVNGIEMYYEIHGDGGTPLVLIHGGGSTIESNFGVILPIFAVRSQVVAMELQAHGRTTDRDSPETFEQDADDVAALLRRLNIEKANFLGFSNGGTTTLQVAMRHPEIVEKIIVVGANSKRSGMPAGFFEMMETAVIDDMPQPLKDAFLKVTPDRHRLQTMFEKDRDRMRAFRDIPDEELRAIKAPTLFIVGDRDIVVEHVFEMSRLIENSRLAVLPGGHGECLGEVCAYRKGSRQPEMTAAIVGDFLDGNIQQ
jgi:pimeloyl-ACP methyl ester carboxylesterase